MPVERLTDRFVKAAAVDVQTDYFDELTKGLSLRVSPGGAKAWNLAYTRAGDGRRARLKLGSYPELSLAEAREAARSARREIGEGADPAQKRQAEAAAMTVSDLIETYAARVLSGQRSGADTIRRLRKNVVPLIGAIKLADLHRRDLTKTLDAVQARGARVEAIALFRNLRTMLRWAANRGDVELGLVAGWEPPGAIKARERFLSDDEIRVVWKALDDATGFDPGTARLLQFLLATGARVGEAAGAALSELDIDRAVWTIPASRVKNGTAHALPLSDLALDIIAAQLAAIREAARRRAIRTKTEYVEPVLLFPGQRIASSVDTHAVARAVSRQTVTSKDNPVTATILGVTPWTPHDLRRTAATGMEILGVSPFVIAHVLNHVSVTKGAITSKVYARYDYMKEKREALNLWSSHLYSLTSEHSSAVVFPMNRR